MDAVKHNNYDQSRDVIQITNILKTLIYLNNLELYTHTCIFDLLVMTYFNACI